MKNSIIAFKSTQKIMDYFCLFVLSRFHGRYLQMTGKTFILPGNATPNGESRRRYLVNVLSLKNRIFPPDSEFFRIFFSI